jgi:hypothetical protein
MVRVGLQRVQSRVGHVDSGVWSQVQTLVLRCEVDLVLRDRVVDHSAVL